MEAYAAYKDSGVEWIGEIPEGWDIEPIKFCGSICPGATPKTDNPMYWDGDIPWITPADYKTAQHYVASGNRFITREGLESCGTMLVPENSVIVSNRAPIGAVCIAENPICTNQGCKAIVASNLLHPNFLYYVLSISDEQLNNLGTGTTFLELSTKALASFLVQIPPLDEQRAIADFLDAKTAEIDGVVDEVERSVGLLREYRKAVVSEAVTKGLDAHAPMKDSGVEWIGEIPEGWTASPLKYFVESIECGTSVDGAAFPAEVGQSGVLTISAVFRGRFNPCANKLVEGESEARLSCPLKVGSLLVSRCNTSEWVGTAAYVNTQLKGLYLPDKLWQLSFKSPDLARYIQYSLQSKSSRTYFEMMSNGASQTMQNLSKSDLLNVLVAVPPVDALREFVNYLDAKTAEIDSLIADKERQVELLREYRKSIVSEAVTGKFRVVGVE